MVKVASFDQLDYGSRRHLTYSSKHLAVDNLVPEGDPRLVIPLGDIPDITGSKNLTNALNCRLEVGVWYCSCPLSLKNLFHLNHFCVA
jgi:hypothetical protein